MREWKRGEIQAIGTAAKLMILGGGFVTLITYLEFNFTTFMQGLPATLTSGDFPTLLGAGIVFLLGCTLAVWLWQIRRKTGISTQAFDRSENKPK